MAKFPKIQSPCPYQDNLSAVMDGDFCRACEREVVDLTAWSDAQRVSFLASRESEVCVSYRRPVRGALIAAAMAAAVVALPAAAQDMPVPDGGYDDDTVIVVGGIKDPKNTEFVEEKTDAGIPEMPVIYEAPKDAVKPAEPVAAKQ